MIILIRHAQSEGNKNREIHQYIPDHRVKLTPEGHKQALEAGRRLRAMLRPDDTLHFFTSPYRRARETTEGILKSLTSDDPSPSPFPRHTIKVYEEPRLREQDFGNFQPCSAEMERMWRERADYGHFFYRIPNGESAADAYDRISGFNESLWRLFGEDDFASVCVLVTHGLMTRIFLMKWYHFSVEYFEDLRNINHCEFVIMEKNPDNGKYILRTKLRTWSELRKERELEKKRERAAKGLPPEPDPSQPEDSPVPVRRKWGGCPNGCNHAAARPKTWRPGRQDTVDLFRDDDDDGGETSDGQTRGAARQSSDLSNPEGKASAAKHKPKANLSIVAHRPESIDEIISSPDQTPSYISLATLAAPRETPSVSGTNAAESGLRPTERTARLPSISPLRLNSDHDDDDDDTDSRSPPPPGPSQTIPSDGEEVDTALQEFHHPSQDAEDDGDDEGSGTRRSVRRSKQQQHHHHHHHHNHHPHQCSSKQQQHQQPSGPRISNILRDGDEHDDEDDDDGADQGDGRRDSLELEREKDQSIRGSVY